MSLAEVGQESPRFQGFMNAPPAPSIIRKRERRWFCLSCPIRERDIEMEEVRRHLPAHWTLDSIRLVSELPKTPAGKIAASSLPV